VQEGEAAPTDAAEEEPSGEEAVGENGAPGEGETADGGDGGAQPGEGPGERASEGGQGNSQGAGERGGRPVPGSGERLPGAPETPLERLAGVRGEGPINRGGEALQRGSDDVDIPNVQVPTDYERAAEEAISEGRIPLEYQEILRDYFR